MKNIGMIIGGYHAWRIIFELEKTRSYYDKVEKFFLEEAERVEKEFDYKTKSYNRLSANQRHELIDELGWEMTSSNSVFPIILRNSVMLSIYNLVEHHLNDICHVYERLAETKITLNEINGKGIERARIFLTKVVGVDFSTINKQWESIKSLNLIRNNIVHNGAILPSDKNHKLSRLVETTPGLSRGSNEELVINDGYIQNAIGVLISFFRGLSKVTLKMENEIIDHLFSK